MDEKQAELLGMHAGDGSLYRTNTGFVWELRGGLDEKDFYDSYVKELVFQATGVLVNPKFRSGGKNGCYGIQSCNKEIVKLLTEASFPVGKKTFTVETPHEILNGYEKLKAGFIRGLVATDGCTCLAKVNGKKVADYPCIYIASSSERLISQVSEILSELGLRHHSWSYIPRRSAKPTWQIRINGVAMTKIFLQKIGLSNPKHFSRIKRQPNSNF